MVNGKKLKRLFTEKGFTAKEFAAECDVNMFTVYRSVNETHVPTMKNLRIYARVLGVRVADLLHDEIFEKAAA